MTSKMTITTDENGFTKVVDSERTTIYLIPYSPDIEYLIELRHIRNRIERQAESCTSEDTPEFEALSKRWRGLTRKIKDEAKRLGYVSHSPFAN